MDSVLLEMDSGDEMLDTDAPSAEEADVLLREDSEPRPPEPQLQAQLSDSPTQAVKSAIEAQISENLDNLTFVKILPVNVVNKDVSPLPTLAPFAPPANNPNPFSQRASLLLSLSLKMVPFRPPLANQGVISRGQLVAQGQPPWVILTKTNLLTLLKPNLLQKLGTLSRIFFTFMLPRFQKGPSPRVAGELWMVFCLTK